MLLGLVVLPCLHALESLTKNSGASARREIPHEDTEIWSAGVCALHSLLAWPRQRRASDQHHRTAGANGDDSERRSARRSTSVVAPPMGGPGAVRRLRRRPRHGDLRALLPRRRAHREPASTSSPQQFLADGNVDFALAWVPKALATREAGADIVNIAQIFQRSGTLQVSFVDAGHHSPEDFEGATSATGASATSTRSSPPWPRPVSTRRTTSRSSSSSSTWSACSKARSTPPRR